MNTLPGFFQSSLLTYVPVGILLSFALLMIAGLHVTGSKPEGVAKAIGCVLLKTFGLVLIGLSAVQLTYALIAVEIPGTETLFALVLLLVTGLGIMIHESRREADIDAASRSVPHAVFCHVCRVIGSLVMVLSGLSLMMTFLLNDSLTGWEMPATLLLLGTLLSLTSTLHVEGKHHRTAKKKR